MKKIIFTIVVQAIIWTLLIAPFILPNEITGYIPGTKAMVNPYHAVIVSAAVIIITFVACVQTASWAERLYEYLRK